LSRPHASRHHLSSYDSEVQPTYADQSHHKGASLPVSNGAGPVPQTVLPASQPWHTNTEMPRHRNQHAHDKPPMAPVIPPVVVPPTGPVHTYPSQPPNVTYGNGAFLPMPFPPPPLLPTPPTPARVPVVLLPSDSVSSRRTFSRSRSQSRQRSSSSEREPTYYVIPADGKQPTRIIVSKYTSLVLFRDPPSN
jgi:hypothetical protein